MTPLRIALALACFFLPRAVLACAVQVDYPIQILTRRAHVVAEGVGTGGRFEIKVTRFWKGQAADVVRLRDVTTNTGNCNSSSPTVAGNRYLFFINSDEPKRVDGVDVFPGDVEIHDLTASPHLVRYFETPARVSSRDLMNMLQGWSAGSVDDEAMRRWVADLIPVAEPDDWRDVPWSGEEESSVLLILDQLEWRLEGLDACGLTIIRERLVPIYLRVLTEPPDTEEEAEAMDAEVMGFDEAELDVCPE